jgi:ribonuclease HI
MNSSPVREQIVAFTDGAASGNPGPGGWAAVVVTPQGHVTELGGGAAHTTNNKMELTGAIKALEHIAGDPQPVCIYTDSSYVIKGITQWVWNWQRRGWKTAEGGDVLNRDLWEQLLALVNAHGRNRVEWHWVRGHDGTPGNERVDEIAVAFSRSSDEQLYDGPLSEYALSILDLPDNTTLPARINARRGSAAPASGGPLFRTDTGRDLLLGTEAQGAREGDAAKKRPTSKGPAYSYLSLIDGALERHATWAECERRVKGRAGARFKKAMSAADEADILRSWGVGVNS